MKFELFILAIAVILCATALTSSQTYPALPLRNLIWCAFTIIAVLSILIKSLRGRVNFGALKSWLIPAFAGYLILTAVSLIHAINVSEGVYVVMRISLAFVFLMVLMMVPDKDVLSKVLTVLSIIFGIYGLWFIAVSSFKYQYGTMCNRNLWSAALFLLLPFCVYTFRQWRVLGSIGAVLLVANILFLGTRSVLLALVVFTVILVFCHRRKLGVNLALGLVCVVVGLAGFRFRTNMIGANQRFIYWRNTLEMITNKPLGIGAGNWRIYFPAYADKNIPDIDNIHVKTYVQSPHNDWVWVWSETGPGVLAYISIFALGLYYAYKRKNFAFFAGIMGFMTIVCFAHLRVRVFHPMILLLMISMSAGGGKLYLSKRKVLVGGVIVLAVLSFVMFGFTQRFRYGKMAHRIRFARFAKQWDVVYANTRKSSWFYSLGALPIPIKCFEGEYYFYNNRMTEALDCFLDAYRANPNHVVTLNNMGTCFAFHDMYEQAIKCYKKALAIRPDLESPKNNMEATLNRIANKINENQEEIKRLSKG